MEPSTSTPASGAPALRRVHTCASLTALGVGGIIGSGIFVMSGKAAPLAGPALMLSFVVSAIAAIAVALCLAECSSRVPEGGSVYAFVRAAFGTVPGWLSGWNFLLCLVVGSGTVASGWSHYVQDSLKTGGLSLPSLLREPPVAFGEGGFTVTGSLIDLPALLIALAVTFIVVRGIQASVLANWGVLAVKLGVLLFVIVVGAFHVRPENWQPFAPLGWGVQFMPKGPPVGMLAAASLMFYAYLGFESVSAHVEEARNPRRDISLATVFSVLIATVIYVSVIAVLTGMVPFRQIDGNAPLSDAFRRVGMPWAGLLVAVGAIAALTNVLIVIVLTTSRVMLALGRDGLLAPLFGEVHPRFLTPWRSTLFAGIGTGLLGGLAPLQVLANIAVMGMLLAFTVVALGVLALRRQQSETPEFQAPLGPVSPLVSIGVCLLLALSLPPTTILWLILWYALGGVIYLRRRGLHAVPALQT